MQKPKSIQNLETQMEALDPASLRYKVLDSARNFKTSWIELGQHLYQIHRSRHFKEWGYLTFEAYCAKEIGVRQATAVKLLKSYYFLEREEPVFLKRSAEENQKPSQIPGYEVVNALRLAKEGNRISEEEYGELREEVLESPKDDETLKKKIRYVLKSRVQENKDDSDTQAERKKSLVKKLLSQLKIAHDEMETLSFSSQKIKQIDTLMKNMLEWEL
jgi:hypothetical protein